MVDIGPVYSRLPLNIWDSVEMTMSGKSSSSNEGCSGGSGIIVDITRGSLFGTGVCSTNSGCSVGGTVFSWVSIICGITGTISTELSTLSPSDPEHPSINVINAQVNTSFFIIIFLRKYSSVSEI